MAAASETLAALNKLSISERRLRNDWNHFKLVYSQMSDGLAHGMASLAELAFPGQNAAASDAGPTARRDRSRTPEFDAMRQAFASAGIDWSIQFDKSTGRHAQEFREKAGARRTLAIESHRGEYLAVKLSCPGSSVELTQAVIGPARLVLRNADRISEFSAANFSELLHAEPEKMQSYLLRPLAELGIEPALHSDLPLVMAAATTGYSPPPPELAKRVDALIEQLSNDSTRDSALRQLIRLFPHAVLHVTEAKTTAPSLETKALLEQVIAAHPGIAQARAYVAEKRLHQDRAYLLGILRDVPYFRAPARARLARLHGKDFGDNARDWPK